MTIAELMAAYEAGPKAVRQAVAGMNADQLRARPIAGKMTTLEVICHLADFEPVYADRMKRVIAEDRPLLLSADNERFLEKLAYGQREIEEEIAIIEHTRSQMLRILRSLPEESFQRTGIYRHDGQEDVRTLERLLTTITNHVPHHLKFVKEKRAALGLPA